MKRLFLDITPTVLTNPLVALFLGNLFAGDKAPLNLLLAAVFAILASLVLRSRVWSASDSAPSAGAKGEILPGSAVREWVIPSLPAIRTVPVLHPGTSLRGAASLVPIIDEGRVVGLAVWSHGVQKPSLD